jgi:hypothetical protein
MEHTQAAPSWMQNPEHNEVSPHHMVAIHAWSCSQKDIVLRSLIEGTFAQVFELIDDYLNGLRTDAVIDGLKRFSIILGDPNVVMQLADDRYFRGNPSGDAQWRCLLQWFKLNCEAIWKNREEEMRWKDYTDEQKLRNSPPPPFAFADTSKIRRIFAK